MPHLSTLKCHHYCMAIFNGGTTIAITNHSLHSNQYQSMHIQTNNILSWLRLLWDLVSSMLISTDRHIKLLTMAIQVVQFNGCNDILSYYCLIFTQSCEHYFPPLPFYSYMGTQSKFEMSNHKYLSCTWWSVYYFVSSQNYVVSQRRTEQS